MGIVVSPEERTRRRWPCKYGGSATYIKYYTPHVTYHISSTTTTTYHIPYHRPYTTYHRPHTTDHIPQTTYYYILHTTDHELQTKDYRPHWPSDHAHTHTVVARYNSDTIWPERFNKGSCVRVCVCVYMLCACILRSIASLEIVLKTTEVNS